MTGAGNIAPEVVPEALKQVWAWIQEHRLQIDIEEVPLKDIAKRGDGKPKGKGKGS